MSDFDAATAEQLKLDGMKMAADNRAAILNKAREIALHVARREGTVNADDVYRGLQMQDIPWDALGPAAGSIFSTPEFEPTGQMVHSLRTTNHRRLIRVWRLRDA